LDQQTRGDAAPGTATDAPAEGDEGNLEKREKKGNKQAPKESKITYKKKLMKG